MKGKKVYLLTRNFGNAQESEVVDIFVNKEDAEKYAKELADSPYSRLWNQWFDIEERTLR